GGDRLQPGDVINTVGTTTLYIYDNIAGATNCSGALSAVYSTKFTEADVQAVVGGSPSHFLATGYDPTFWSDGAAIEIEHLPTDPQRNAQTYKVLVGDVQLTGDPDCFGSAVRINPRVTVTNNGPGVGRGYAGRLSIVNNMTNSEIETVELVDTPVDAPITLTIDAVVPISDLIAGNISILIALETNHGAGYEKDWKVEGFSVDYQFLPEFSVACPAEETFDVTIYEMPTAAAGDDQTQYNSGGFT